MTILVILAGMAIYGYLASAIVELIAHGVLSGVLTERRRNRVIRGLRDHYIICGYGRVGRRVGNEFRDAGVHYVVLDSTPDSKHFAGEDKRAVRRGDWDARRGPRGRRPRPRQGASSHRATRTSTTSTSSSPPGPHGRTCSSSPGRRPRTRAARCGVPAPTASSSRTPPPARRWRSSCSGPRWRRSSTSSRASAGPTCRWRRSSCRPRCENAGKTIRELRIGRETGALIVALRKPDGSFDTTPSADASSTSAT